MENTTVLLSRNDSERLAKVLQTGKFVGVTFRKKNGQMRNLTGRAGVGKHTNGKGMAYNPADKNMITIWESTRSNRKSEGDKGYRMVTLHRVIQIRANKLRYNIV